MIILLWLALGLLGSFILFLTDWKIKNCYRGRPICLTYGGLVITCFVACLGPAVLLISVIYFFTESFQSGGWTDRPIIRCSSKAALRPKD